MKTNISKEWLRASNDDIKIIIKILDDNDLSHMIAFHSQQSIEKSFKALIEYKNIKVPKQHDLLKLREIIAEDMDFTNDDMLDTLNELYIDSRYPGDMGLLPYAKPTLEDAKEFYEFALHIFEKACEILKIDKSKLA